MLTVHGRTRQEMYEPGIHAGEIARVKAAVGIPVWANGDVTSAQGALALLGCVLGGLVLTATGAGWAGWLAAAGFLVCYLIGCALAVLAVGRTQLMSLLSERE